MKGWYKWIIVLVVLLVCDVKAGSKLFKISYNVTLAKDGIMADPRDMGTFVKRPMLHRHVYASHETRGRRDIPSRMSHKDFVIVYDDQSPPPMQVEAVMEMAISIWSSLLEDIVVPIVVKVSWLPLKENVLGSAGPRFVYLYTDGYFYVDAQINQLTRQDQEPDTEDIVVFLNSDYPSWHFDVDEDVPVPKGKYDLLTVVLHELGHGLGIIGLISSEGHYGGDGFHTYIYDAKLIDSTEQPILDQQTINSPEALTQRLNSLGDDGLFFFTDKTTHPSLYNTVPFNAGSTVYHLSETAYPAGHRDSLMTPYLGASERILSPGAVGSCLLSQMGWTMRDCAEYTANCRVCIDADCVWCGSTCVDPGRSESECVEDICDTHCLSDGDCDDLNDRCRNGQCNVGTGECEYFEVDCNDEVDCTEDVCDSKLGCLHLGEGDDCVVGVCSAHIETIKSATDERGWADESEIERVVVFDPLYRDWLVHGIQVRILFDKVDATCTYPSHGHAWANELYISLKTPDGVRINLIVENTFTSFANLDGPFDIVFSDDAKRKINAALPQNGTFHAHDQMQHKLSASGYTTRVGVRPWMFVFGDTARGDPACFYAATLQLRVAPPEYEVPSSDLVLCSGTDSLALDSLQILLEIPENFFDIASEAVVSRQVMLSACGVGSLQRINDLAFSPDSTLASTPIKILRLELCAEERILVTYADETREDEFWELQAGISPHPQPPHGTLTLNRSSSSPNTYTLTATVYFEFVFTRRGRVPRRLGEDMPPGYAVRGVGVVREGEWSKERMDSIELL